MLRPYTEIIRKSLGRVELPSRDHLSLSVVLMLLIQIHHDPTTFQCQAFHSDPEKFYSVLTARCFPGSALAAADITYPGTEHNDKGSRGDKI